jgi:hypothetical protein
LGDGTVHGFPKVVGFDEVRDEDFCSGSGEGLRPMIWPSHEGIYGVALFEELVRERISSFARSRGDDDRWLVCHHVSLNDVNRLDPEPRRLTQNTHLEASCSVQVGPADY